MRSAVNRIKELLEHILGILDSSQPLYNVHTSVREKASKVSAKYARVGCGVCERSEQEAGVQFSRDSIGTFNDRIKIRENRRP